jgi:hypothetical protein
MKSTYRAIYIEARSELEGLIPGGIAGEGFCPTREMKQH